MAKHHHADAPESELFIEGMNCANCVQHVTGALQGVPGVSSVEVSIQNARAHVHWREAGTTQSLIDAVTAAGFEAKAVPQGQDEGCCGHAHSRWKFNVIVGACGAIPLMLGEWLFRWSGQPWFGWTSFAVAMMIQVLCGARFYRGAWRQLRVGASNMDTLVALGSSAAFGYSAWLLFSHTGGHLYFMEAVAIITLISVGHWMEELASRYAENSLRALFQLAPETAIRRDADGSEREVPVAELHLDDVAIVRPGARVPTDGIIMDGRTSVNEAMLTGESMPVEKSSGATLYAGTINMDGRVTMRVMGVGQSTAVAQIVAAVQRAQSSRAEIQRLADRISNVFVPIIVTIAVAAGLWWGCAYDSAVRFHERLGQHLWMSHMPADPLSAGIFAAVAVLIVACPCAMGLATPVAIMAGTNVAAKRGILIRDGIALEKAGRLTAVLADKTGTLTLGKPEVTDSWWLIDSVNHGDIAGSLAQHSNHPLSLAISRQWKNRVPLSAWREWPGSGVEAKTVQGMAKLGSLAWLQSSGVDCSAGAAFAEKWSGEGATLLGFSVNNAIAGVIALRDTPKPEIQSAFDALRRMGLKTFLVTGDNPRTAVAVAKLAGIDPKNVFAEVRPEAKAGIVRDLQQRGERVAFIGDGINDAPALEQADLGIAVGKASDVAHDAADIILLQSSLLAVPESIDLAQATLRTIKQNLFWAFFYNCLAVPLAALGFLSPILCAGAMGISDLVVIGNAIRLRHHTRPK